MPQPARPRRPFKLGGFLQRRRAAQTCSFCRDALDAERSSPCTACGTRLHDACWGELSRGPSGGCPTPGCGGVRAPSIDEPAAAECGFCRRRAVHGLPLPLRSDELWTCPGCGEQGHPDCWGTICPTAGCRRLPPELRRELESGPSGKALSDGCIAVVALAVIVICACVIDVVVDVFLRR